MTIGDIIILIALIPAAYLLGRSDERWAVKEQQAFAKLDSLISRVGRPR